MALALLLSSTAVSPARASTWVAPFTNGFWNASSNWTGGVPNGVGAIADFSTLDISFDDSVHLDAPETVGTLIFGDALPTNNWTLDNNGLLSNVLTLAVNSGAPTITVNNQSAAISAVLAGNQGLTVDGAGTLILSGADTYTGATTLSGGKLKLDGSTGSLSSTSSLTLAAGATFTYDNSNGLTGRSQTLGALAFSGGDSAVVSSTGFKNISLTYSSLSARPVGATGNFVVSGGTNGGSNKIALGGVTANSFINAGVFFGGGTSVADFAWYDTAGYVRGISYGSGVGFDPGSELVSGAQTSFTSGKQYEEISGPTGSITNQGTQAITSLNFNFGGSVSLAGGSVLTVSGILTSGSGATSAIGGGGAGGGIQAGSNGELVVRTDQAGSSFSINTPILANGVTPLTKSGAGTPALNSNNRFNGLVTIDAGTLAVVKSCALNSSSPNAVAFGGGSTGTLSLNGFNITLSGLSTNSLVGSPVVQNNGPVSATLTVANSVPNVYAGALQDGGGAGGNPLAVYLAGSSTLTLGGVNTFTGGVTLHSGTLHIGGSGALNAANPDTVTFDTGSTGVLALSGNSITIGGLNNNAGDVGVGTVRNASATPATLTVVNAVSPSNFAGSLQDGVGGGSLKLVNGGGQLTLNGANTYTGATIVGGGQLILGPTGSLGSTAIAVTSGAAFSARPGSGVISAGGSLTLNPASSFDMLDSSIGTFNITGGGIGLSVVGSVGPDINKKNSFEIDNEAASTERITVSGDCWLVSRCRMISAN
jgi:autotransporter-associated beta strand protein